MSQPIIFAIPKGRILSEALPLLAQAGIVPEAAFGDKESRALKFATNCPDISLIRVRAFDVATFVAHGAAQLGIVGSDVLAEFGYSELYAPVDLGIGHCRISVAEASDGARVLPGHAYIAPGGLHLQDIAKGLERVRGIEPPYSAWEAAALPLSYTRVGRTGNRLLALRQAAKKRVAALWAWGSFCQSPGALASANSAPAQTMPR